MVGEPLCDLATARTPLLSSNNFTEGDFMKTEWLITIVTPVGCPDRAHSSFCCTMRFVLCSRQCGGSRAALARSTKKFTIKTIFCHAQDPIETDRIFGGLWLARSQSLLGCSLPTFHVIFRESNTKCVKSGGNRSNFSIMPPFLCSHP